MIIDYSFFNFSDAHLTSKNILYTFICILQYYIQSVHAHESNSGIICFVFLSLIEEKKDNATMHMYIYGHDVFDFYLIKGILPAYFGMSLCYTLVLA